MATYIKGVTDEFGKIVPYQPNWQFLTAVYSAGQARYDRGFNQVKSLYNSVLNSPVTNDENRQFRDDMFRKLQKSLHSVSGVDLSDPTNIKKAKALLNPISQDEDLVYDIHVTKHHQQQKSLMDQYKNSTDPEKREMYSDYSAMDIGFAEEDLRSAKRGDGSIKKVTPRDFTPFEDINKFLAEQAKEQGLGIKYSTKDPKNPAYLYKIENGEMAYKPFTSWAMGVMGPRFDRQFDVMGRVSGENQIRSMMKEQGISREDAINTISQDMAKKLQQDRSDEAQFSMSNLAQVENKIETYKQLYKDGFPYDKPEVKEEYMELLEARDILEKNYSNASEESRKIMEDPSYVSNNIYSHLTAGARQATAMQWAMNYADATAKMDMEADQVYLTQMRISSQERLAKMKMAHQQKMHNEKMAFEMQKAVNKGEMPGEENMGQFTAPGEEGANYTGVEALEASYDKTKGDLYNKVFAAEKGIVNLALAKNSDYGKYVPTIAKVRKMSEGQNVVLNDQDKRALVEYYNKVGGTDMNQVATPQNAAEAAALVDNLVMQTYDFASNKLSMYKKSGKSAEAQKYFPIFDGAFSDMRTLVQERKNINANYENIAKLAQQDDMKEIFEDAPIVGYTGSGSPIYDLSGLSEAERNFLSEKSISSEFSSRSRPTGNTYNMTGMTASEAYNIAELADLKGVEVEYEADKLKDVNLKSLNRTNLRNLFGKQMKVSYDPASQDAIITVSVDMNSSEAKSLGIKGDEEQMTLRIPYETLQARRGSLGRLATYADANTVNPVSYGLFDVFASDSTSTVNAPSYMKSSGFNWSVTGSFDENGRRGLLFEGEVYDPKAKVTRDLNQRFFHVDFGDPNDFVKVSQTINDIWTKYGMSLAMYD